MKKRDLLMIAAVSLGIGGGWMVLNETVFAQEENELPAPMTEYVESNVLDATIVQAESKETTDSTELTESSALESEKQNSENEELPVEKPVFVEQESKDEMLEQPFVETQPETMTAPVATVQSVSVQSDANQTLNTYVIKMGQTVNMADLLGQYDCFVIQADAGYGQVNTNFSVLADQVLRGEKKLMMYHDGRAGKNVEDGNMEAYGFYNVIKNYIGKGLPVLRFMNDANTGPNWAQTFMDTLYGLSGVRGIVWTNQEKINDGDWSQYDAANYPYTTDVTKYEASDVPWNEQIKVNHASEVEELYRLYNPNSGEHFYTKRSAERDDLVRVGWRYESLGWTTPTEGMGAQVYRLYNPNAGDHHYTMDAGERDMLIGKGWRYEGVGWYSDKNKATAIYRAYNPNAKAGAHHFTSNKEEKDYLVRLGWRDEKIGFYGIVSTLLPRDLPMESYLKGEYGYNTSGAKLSGVQKVQGNYYYFDNQASKAMKKGSGLTQVGNKSVYVNGNGTLQVGQMNTNGGWKWFDPNSAYMVKSTFIDIPAAYNSGKAKRVYYDGNGNMVHGSYTLGNYRFTTNGEGIIIGSELLNLRSKYFMQTDPRWGGIYYGYLPLSSSGCVVTSAATIINYFAGTNHTPVNIANLAYRNGYLNSRTDGSTSDIWRFLSNYYGLSYQNHLSYNAAKQALIDGKIVTGAVGYSRWCPWYGITHEIYMSGYNNGKVTVYDPINTANCGVFNLADIFSVSSTSWVDTMDGGPFYAIGKR